MPVLQDAFNKITGRDRFGVCRIFVQISGEADVADLLDILNQAGNQALDQEGDLEVLGEGVVEIAQGLLQRAVNWRSAANEGDVFWEEGLAGDYVSELFTDSAQRYLSSGGDASAPLDELPVAAAPNLVVMLTVAFSGEADKLETDLAEITALKAGLTQLIDLHYQNRLRAIQVHFSPASAEDVLTADHLLENFPELIPL